MKERRILVGLTYFTPNISGLTVYVERMIKQMPGLRYQISVITAKYTETKEESNVIRVPGLRFGKGFIMPSYLFRAWTEVQKADIIWCHLPMIESFWLALWAKAFNKKLVVTYHCYFDSGNLIVNKLIEWWQNITLLLADKIIVNSFDYIDSYGLLKNYRRKTVEIFPPIISDVRSQISDVSKKGKTIGYLGRISKEKKLEVLIEAMKYLPKDFKLILAGGRKTVGEDDYKKKVENLIKKDKRISDIGEVKNQSELFVQIDCLVLPSNNRLESFGMVSAEAINCGIPVVVSDTPGARVPILQSRIGELFEPGNAKDLAEKIKQAVEKNYKTTGNFFDINDTVDKYEQVFKESFK